MNMCVHHICVFCYFYSNRSLIEKSLMSLFLYECISECVFIFLAVPHSRWACGILITYQGSNPYPLHWKCGVNHWMAREFPLHGCFFFSTKGEGRNNCSRKLWMNLGRGVPQPCMRQEKMQDLAGAGVLQYKTTRSAQR